MKEQYTIDYQNNYQINVNEKQSNIDEFVATLDDKKTESKSLEQSKLLNMSTLDRFTEMNRRLFYYRVCFKYMKIYVKARKEK